MQSVSPSSHHRRLGLTAAAGAPPIYLRTAPHGIAWHRVTYLADLMYCIRASVSLARSHNVSTLSTSASFPLPSFRFLSLLTFPPVSPPHAHPHTYVLQASISISMSPPHVHSSIYPRRGKSIPIHSHLVQSSPIQSRRTTCVAETGNLEPTETKNGIDSGTGIENGTRC